MDKYDRIEMRQDEIYDLTEELDDYKARLKECKIEFIPVKDRLEDAVEHEIINKIDGLLWKLQTHYEDKIETIETRIIDLEECIYAEKGLRHYEPLDK